MLGTSWECHKVREFALRPMGDFLLVLDLEEYQSSRNSLSVFGKHVYKITVRYGWKIGVLCGFSQGTPKIPTYYMYRSTEVYKTISMHTTNFPNLFIM